jgi:hypothetical protein
MKMKFFGKAMAIVRKAPRKANGKLENSALAYSTSRMLAAVRSKQYESADVIAKSIIAAKGGKS